MCYPDSMNGFSLDPVLKKFVGKVSTVLSVPEDHLDLRVHFYDHESIDVALCMKNTQEFFICRFSLAMIPGTFFLLSHNTYIAPFYQKKGISFIMQDAKEEIAKKHSYTKMVCTVNQDNDVQLHILEKTRWKEAGKIPPTTLIYYKEL